MEISIFFFKKKPLNISVGAVIRVLQERSPVFFQIFFSKLGATLHVYRHIRLS